jgi:hypothetical protein
MLDLHRLRAGLDLRIEVFGGRFGNRVHEFVEHFR